MANLVLCPKCMKPPALHNVDGSCWDGKRPQGAIDGQEAFQLLTEHAAPMIEHTLKGLEELGSTSLYEIASDMMMSLALQGKSIPEISNAYHFFMVGWAACKRFGKEE